MWTLSTKMSRVRSASDPGVRTSAGRGLGDWQRRGVSGFDRGIGDRGLSHTMDVVLEDGGLVDCREVARPGQQINGNPEQPRGGIPIGEQAMPYLPSGKDVQQRCLAARAIATIGIISISWSPQTAAKRGQQRGREAGLTGEPAYAGPSWNLRTKA